MRIIGIGDRLIDDGEPRFIIAEAGSNHNGSLEQAKELIDVAVEAGADAVKFQTFEIVDLELLQYAARKGKPRIISTGMANLGEIEDAINAIKSVGNDDIILLHCNLKNGLLEVGEIEEKGEVDEMIDRLRIRGGEADVFRLYKSGEVDAISSDDGKFLEILDALDIPYLTPSALIIHLFKRKVLSKIEAETYINEMKAIRQFIKLGVMWYVVELYKRGKITLGEAAELSGISLRRMLDILTEHGVKGNVKMNQQVKALDYARNL